MKKKILAVLLSAMLVATTLIGCGSDGASNSSAGSDSDASGAAESGDTDSTAAESSDTDTSDVQADSGDIPTISLMVICGSIPTDADQVAEALSEITREKIGCNVEFICMEIANVAQQLNLLLSGGDDTLDVFMAGNGVSYGSVVNNGQALALDDLMEPYAEEMKTLLGENVYEAGRVNGQLYGIGHLLDQASTGCFNLRADIAEEFGYKNGDKINLTELTELFRKIREKYPDTPIIGPMNGGPNVSDSRVDSLGDGNKLGVLGNYGQDTTITNYYESEEYVELVNCFKEWKEMGCYMSDFLNVTEAPVDYIPANKAFGCFASHFSAEMNGIWSSKNFGAEMVSLQMYSDAVAVTPWAYECINPASKNPEKAAALIYLMATDPEVENILINGIEGTHYQVLDDGTATFVEGKDISTTGWCLGYSWTAQNSTISTPFEYPDDYYDQLLSANKNANQSKAFGCQFDMTGVSDAVSACTNVVNQYANALASGSVEDFEGTLAQFQQSLRDAGIDEIIKARQEQLDAYLAK